MTIELLARRLSAPVTVFLLTWVSMVAAVHAADSPRKMTVVSFGLFGDEGVFRREATSAAQIVANRFGGDPVVVKYNTKTGGSATVETGGLFRINAGIFSPDGPPAQISRIRVSKDLA